MGYSGRSRARALGIGATGAALAASALACDAGGTGRSEADTARCSSIAGPLLAPPAVAPARPSPSRAWADALNGTLRTAPDPARSHGGRVVRARFRGNANGYARVVERTAWSRGDVVTYGADFFLPRGFKAAAEGEVSLMRWDNWPTRHGQAGGADQGGLVLWGSDKRARLKVGRYHSHETAILGPFDLPEARWFRLAVRQRMSPSSGQAASIVFLDGHRVGCSTAANMGGHVIERMRFGLVAIAGHAQRRPLELWMRGVSSSARPPKRL